MPENTTDWRIGVTNTSQVTLQEVPFQKFEPGSIRTVANIELSTLRELTIPIPNASALLLSGSNDAFVRAQEIWKLNELDVIQAPKVNFKTDNDAFRFLELKMHAILFAFTSIEAFANESIPDDYVYVRHQHSEVILEASFKKSTERHTSLEEKLEHILPNVFKVKSPKGTACWADYRKLKTVRDRLIHMKSEDRRYVHMQPKTLWRDITLMSAPHLLALNVISHFLRSAEHPPWWYAHHPFHEKTRSDPL
jgi:hypothetical protein